MLNTLRKNSSYLAFVTSRSLVTKASYSRNPHIRASWDQADVGMQKRLNNQKNKKNPFRISTKLILE